MANKQESSLNQSTDSDEYRSTQQRTNETRDSAFIEEDQVFINKPLSGIGRENDISLHPGFCTDSGVGSQPRSNSTSSNQRLSMYSVGGQYIIQSSNIEAKDKIKDSPNNHASQSEQSKSNLEDNILVDKDTMIEALKRIEQFGASIRHAANLGRQVTFGTCAFGFFGSDGGRLTIPGSQISLYIPRGAIQTKQSQLIYVFEVTTGSDEPELDKKETWLTPTVECGPSGVQFEKDVFLTLPHCAIDTSQMKFTVYRGDQRVPNWMKLEEGKQTIVIVGERKFTLAIDHFSPYKISGARRIEDHCDVEVPVSKYMKVGLFHDETVTSSTDVRVLFRIRLCNLQDWRRILLEEGISSSSSEKKVVSDSIPVFDNTDDITIRLKEENPQWKVLGELEQHVTFDNIWSNYQQALDGGSLSIPITLTKRVPSKPGPSEVDSSQDKLCTVNIAQNDEYEIDLVAILPSAEGDGQKSQLSVEKVVDVDSVYQQMEDRFLAQQDDLSPGPESLCYICDARYRRICSYLDGASELQGGWNAFAGLIGMNNTLLRHSIEMRALCQRRSPSSIVLDFFFSEYQGMNVLDTLGSLSNIFLDINNYLAKQVVDEEIQEKSHRVTAEVSKTIRDQVSEATNGCALLESEENKKCEETKHQVSDNFRSSDEPEKKTAQRRQSLFRSVKKRVLKSLKPRRKEAAKVHGGMTTKETRDKHSDRIETDSNENAQIQRAASPSGCRSDYNLKLNDIDQTSCEQRTATSGSVTSYMSRGSSVAESGIESHINVNEPEVKGQNISRYRQGDSGIYSDRSSRRSSSQENKL